MAGESDPRAQLEQQLKADGLAEDTIEHVNYWLSRFEREGVNILKPEEVKAFISEQKWNNHVKATVVAYYGVFAERMHLQWKPPKYRYEDKIPFVPTEKEIDDLIAGCGPKTSAFLRVLKETGCRIGEALRLQWRDIDFNNHTITINDPEKGSRPRRVSISPTLIATLNLLPQSSQRVFNCGINSVESNFQRSRNRLVQKLGNDRLKQIHLHTFRHFSMTMLYARTLNVLKVQERSGLKNLQNVLKYTHLVEFQCQDFDVQIPQTVEDGKKLMEVGYEPFNGVVNGVQVTYFRKRKL